MKGVIINFSGHSLCREAKADLALRFETIIDAEWPEFDFDECVVSQIEAAICAIPIHLDGTAPVTIIPPGQSTLAILLVSFLHGMLGHFPQVCYLERNGFGLYVPKFDDDIDLQGTRSAGRRLRLKARNSRI